MRGKWTENEWIDGGWINGWMDDGEWTEIGWMDDWMKEKGWISVHPLRTRDSILREHISFKKKQKKNKQWLRLDWILPYSRRASRSIPASVDRLCAGAAPQSFWSDELCLLISSNRALIKAAGSPELLGVGVPEAATFKSYTLCRAEGTSLTWWESSRTVLQPCLPSFLSPPQRPNISFTYRRVLLGTFYFPSLYILTQHLQFCYQSREQCCDSQVFQQNTSWRLVCRADVFLLRKK